MPLIRIQEVEQISFDTLKLEIQLADKAVITLEVRNPFIQEDQHRLDWYFETYLSEPYIAETRVKKAKETIFTKGEELFQFTLGHDLLYRHFQELRNQYPWEEWVIEVIGESPHFFDIYWEAMALPGGIPLAASGVQYVRKNPTPSNKNFSITEKPTLNLLLVSARPSEEKDVNPHTIQRPLIERMQEVGPEVRVHVLRPGTFRALKEHLDDHIGFYHLIHFDLHGTVISYPNLKEKRDEDQKIRFYGPHTFQVNWGLTDISPYEGTRAFLFFESEPEDTGKAVPVPSQTLAETLEEARIPVCILNACQSSKQPEASKEMSIAKALMEAGMQLVLAMSHSISVTAADLLMRDLYQSLLKGLSLEKAIARARKGLYRDKNREATLGQTIELEDWILPQVYQNRPVDFSLRPFEPEEEEKLFHQKYQRNTPPKPPYKFHGRELDILKIEKLLINPDDYRLRRHLLLRGMVGVGKSTLLAYLAWWWEETRWADRVVFLDLGTRHFTWKGILNEIGMQIFPTYSKDNTAYKAIEDEIVLEGKITQLFKKAGTRWILIIDQKNPHHLTFRDSLKATVATKLKRFLMNLPQNMAVVYSSRNQEQWLSEGTFEHNVYQLQGLRKEEQYILSKHILRVHHLSIEALTANDTSLQQFEALMELMQGFPSVMETILPLLKDRPLAKLLSEYYDGSIWASIPTKTKAPTFQLFVSYAHEDKELIEPLLAELEKKGVHIWWDQFEIQVGDSSTDQINRGIRDSDLCLLILSPAFLKSPWAQAELRPFLHQQRLNQQKKLLPVWYQLDEADLLVHKPLLADLHALILDAESDMEDAAYTIIDALYKLNHEPSSPTHTLEANLKNHAEGVAASKRARMYLEENNLEDAIQELAATVEEMMPHLQQAYYQLVGKYETLKRDRKEEVISQVLFEQQAKQIQAGFFELT